MKKINFTLLSGLFLAGISLYYSATGLTHLFKGAGLAIPIMAVAFETAKVTGTVWLIRNRKVSLTAAGLTLSILLLSAISSLGAYGYLGRAYNSGRSDVIDHTARTTSLTADVERLQKDKDRLMAQIEAVPASQGSNRIRLTKELQPRIDKLEGQISAKRDSLGTAGATAAKAENDVGEWKYPAALFGVSAETLVQRVMAGLAFLLDPLAVLLVMASGVKNRRVGEEVKPADEATLIEEPKPEPVLAPEPPNIERVQALNRDIDLRRRRVVIRPTPARRPAFPASFKVEATAKVSDVPSEEPNVVVTEAVAVPAVSAVTTVREARRTRELIEILSPTATVGPESAQPDAAPVGSDNQTLSPALNEVVQKVAAGQTVRVAANAGNAPPSIAPRRRRTASAG